MQFLDKFVVIQSGDNLNLLIIILIISFCLLLPYSGLVSSASLLSLIFNRLGRKNENNIYLHFSYELIYIATFRKGLMLTFGVVPFLTIAFSYIQLFQQIDSSIVSYLLFAFILFISGLILLFYYKYAFQLDNLFKNVNLQSDKVNYDELSGLVSNNKKLFTKTSLWGMILFYLATFLLIGCIEVSTYSISNNNNYNFPSTLFSIKTFIKYLSFLSFSMIILSVAVLLYTNRIKRQSVEDYRLFVNKFALITGIIAVIIFPALIVIDLLSMQYFTLTGLTFSVAGIILLLLFIAAHYYYVMIKESHLKFINHLLVIIIFISSLLVINDQTFFQTSSKKQIVILSQKYDKMIAGLKEESGKTPEINGQEIYEGRCSACHRFETKLVGPAYKDVLPKYENNRIELISFIMNPVKKNPNFPPMPNQGLNQKQAQAIADYIMKTYKTK
jgi:cytochrome c